MYGGSFQEPPFLLCRATKLNSPLPVMAAVAGGMRRLKSYSCLLSLFPRRSLTTGWSMSAFGSSVGGALLVPVFGIQLITADPIVTTIVHFTFVALMFVVVTRIALSLRGKLR
jgi:hypothetical protein